MLAAYLQSLRSAAPVRVEVVTNPENRGFPAACNQGLQAAHGDYLVLLNNDAVVAADWLDQLVALAEADPKIGLAGPMSNYATPPQLGSSKLGTTPSTTSAWRSTGCS